MRSVPFPLEPGAHGKGVADLHRALEEIGVRITQSDVNRRTFGTSTERALSSFQMAHGLSATGVVDRDTAVRLNEVLQDRGALAEGERAPDALPPGIARVRGTVTHASGPALPRMVVRAIERGIFEERELGKVRTSDTGTFTIEYRLEAGRPVDLQLQVLDRKKACVARSAVFLRAPSDHRAQLVVTDPDWPVPSEFEILGWRLEEVMEATDQDLDQLEGLPLAVAAGQAGVDVGATVALVTAQRLSHETDIDAEILYGLLRAGLPSDPIRLFTHSYEALRAALDQQIEANHVSAKAARALKSARKELEALRLQHLLAPGPEGARLPSLAWVLDHAGVTDAQARQATVAQITKAADPEALWRALGRKGGLPAEQIQALEHIAVLSELTLRCAPLIEALLPEVQGAAEGIEHLATLSEADWRSRIEPIAPEQLPAELAGADDPIGAFVAALQRTLAATFPATALKHRVQDGDFEGAEHVRELLSQHPQLDLLDPALGGQLEDRPFDDPVRVQLEAFQRLWSLSPAADRYTTTAALRAAQLSSAHEIAALGHEAFLERVGDRLEASTAEQVFDAATQRVALTGLHAVQLLSAPEADAPQLIDDEAHLFDLLSLLASLPSEGSTALEILAQRRPDLASLTPGDRGTVDYIELVDQVLGAHSEGTPSDEGGYPWSLPVCRATQEADAWLGALGIARGQLLSVLHPGAQPSENATFAIDAEAVGLSLLHAEIVVGESGGEPEGWGVESFRELRELSVLLDRAGLTRSELWALLQTETVNPSGKLEVEEGQLPGMSKAYASRLQRFLRLQRALGWSVRQLDVAIQALGPKRLDRGLLHKLAELSRLHRRLEVSVDTVLSWWTPSEEVLESITALKPGEAPESGPATALLESFAQAAGASVSDVLALRRIGGVDPFDGRKVDSTARAVEILGKMRTLGIGAAHLEAALTLQPTHEDEVIALMLRLGGGLEGLSDRAAADSYLEEELLAWLELEPPLLSALVEQLSQEAKGLEPLHHKALPGADEEQCGGRALRPARQLLLTLRKASHWIRDLGLSADALPTLLQQGWLELAALPTGGKGSAPFGAWLALVEVLCLDRSWPDRAPGLFEILGAAGQGTAELCAALSKRTGFARKTLESLLDPDHLDLAPASLQGPAAAEGLLRIEACRLLLEDLGKLKLTALWRDNSEAPGDWRTLRPSPAEVAQIARTARRHTDAAAVEAKLQRQIRAVAMDATLATLRSRAPQLKTRQDLLEYLLIDVDGGSSTPRIVEATAAVKRFIQRIALGLEPGLHLSDEALSEWRTSQAGAAWREARQAVLTPEEALSPELLEARIAWLSTLPERASGAHPQVDPLSPPQLVVGPDTPGATLQIPEDAIVKTHTVTLETIEAVEARSEPAPPATIVIQLPERAGTVSPGAQQPWAESLEYLTDLARSWQTAQQRLQGSQPELAVPIYEVLLLNLQELQPHPELASAWWASPSDPALALLLRPEILQRALVGEFVDLLLQLGDERLEADRYEAARCFQRAAHVLRGLEPQAELPQQLEPPRAFLELVTQPQELSSALIRLEAHQPAPTPSRALPEPPSRPPVPQLLTAARWFVAPESRWLARQRRVAERQEVVGNQIAPTP